MRKWRSLLVFFVWVTVATAFRVKQATVKKRPPVESTEGGTATIPVEVFNLAKAIVGVGALSLPAGIAFFGDSPVVALPAFVLIVAIGVMSAYGFAVLGKVCAYTKASSYTDAWTKSVGSSSSWIPAVSITSKTFLVCLACSMVLADTFSGILALSDQRAKILWTLTVTVLLPLCWMKNLGSLAPFSLVGIIGMVYTTVAMVVRYLDGSYGADGTLVDKIASTLRPAFGSSSWKSVFSVKSLILISSLSTAYMAHFNAPKFYKELRNNTLTRFNRVVVLGFGIAIAITAVVAVVGFLTFGTAVSSVALNNYASSDALMSLSRIAVAVSLTFTFPFAFHGCRDGILEMVGASKDTRLVNATTVILLTTLTVLAMILKDVSFVLAFGGGTSTTLVDLSLTHSSASATLGNALAYVYPAIMYNGVARKQNLKEPLGLVFSNISAVLGMVMGVIGAKITLSGASS